MYDSVFNKASQKILPYIKAIKNKGLNGPISLHLFITDYCVNKCNMCDHWKTENKQSLSFDIIDKIFKRAQQADVESICLSGGDPVCHPDFKKILISHSFFNFDLGIITTGNFAKDFDYEFLSKLAYIRFSIDSLNPDVYKIIRGRDNLSTILQNVLRARYINPNIGINVTLQKNNYTEIVDFVDYAVNNGIKRLIFYPAHHVNKDIALDSYDKEQIVNILEVLLKSIPNKLKKIPENNVEFLYKYLNGDFKFRKPHAEVPCIINKIHMVVGADGRVFPCCAIADDTDSYGERDVCMGNIYKEDIIDIWDRNYYNEFISKKCAICLSRYLPINETYHGLKDKKIFI